MLKENDSKMIDRLKIRIISRIKKRLKTKKILNEISNDIEKIKLKPENLIFIDYINQKLSEL